MAISTTLRQRRLSPDSDQAAMQLRAAHQSNRLMRGFGPELAVLQDTVGRHDTNKTVDVAKVQSLLGAHGYVDLRGMDGPTGFYSEQDLERPLKKFQKDNGLKTDARVKPGGPTIRAPGKIVDRENVRGNTPVKPNRAEKQSSSTDRNSNKQIDFEKIVDRKVAKKLSENSKITIEEPENNRTVEITIYHDSNGVPKKATVDIIQRRKSGPSYLDEKGSKGPPIDLRDGRGKIPSTIHYHIQGPDGFTM